MRRRRLSGGVGGETQAVDLTLESDGEDEDEVRVVAEKGPVDLTHLEESPPREPWTGCRFETNQLKTRRMGRALPRGSRAGTTGLPGRNRRARAKGSSV